MVSIPVGVGVNPYKVVMKSGRNFVRFISGVIDPVAAIFQEFAKFSWNIEEHTVQRL